MKITTNRLPASHSNLLFWGADACNKRDLQKAVGRYDEKSDELYLAGEDDLTRKVKNLLDIGVNLRAHKHKNGNYFIADTFATPTSTDSINEMVEEPKYKSCALSFTDFAKNQENAVKSIHEPDTDTTPELKKQKPDMKKSLSETELELIQMYRRQSSDELIAATLAELKECYV